MVAILELSSRSNVQDVIFFGPRPLYSHRPSLCPPLKGRAAFLRLLLGRDRRTDDGYRVGPRLLNTNPQHKILHAGKHTDDDEKATWYFELIVSRPPARRYWGRGSTCTSVSSL
eukprot:scaffold173396_cov43-Attheya_sp.AAC.1